jgi:hypothetical protein
MTWNGLIYQPIEGKTYSLFGDSKSTGDYYHTIRSLADKILAGNDINILLEKLKKYSAQQGYLKRIFSGFKNKSSGSIGLSSIHEPLKQYTRKTNEHLKNISFSKFLDRRLATTEEQYHLYMLEIELTNRRNRTSFLLADRKISLQPYCLQDFSVTCKASDSGFDYQCGHCSKNCFQHHASILLKENNIEPYIWMGASIGDAVREAAEKNQTIGILGIACIPELVWGMRKCRKLGIPVIGLPLNANRCARWFGEFHQNSIDLNALELLIRKV